MKGEGLDQAAIKGKNTPSRDSQEEPPIGFLNQTSFVARLCQERRRAERSSRQFALMLVEGGPSFSVNRGYGLLQTVASTLIESMRKTDVVGLHEDDVAVGVILTEFGDWEIRPALAAIEARVNVALRDALPLQCIARIRISFHVFPEEWNFQDADFATDSALYPDLPGLNGNGAMGRALKRTIDIAGSLFAILLMAPVFIGIWIAIRLTSRGPVFFHQERVGQFGVPFTLYKFRSMHCKADTAIHENYVKQFIAGQVDAANTAGLYKLNNDPRVTPIGKLLRSTSLDEIPQFFNVLKGDMSLVGPRPPIPYELEAYDQWHRRRLLESQPGITGLWQVNGRGKVRFDEMVRLDLRYAAEQSMWLDLWILAKTPWAVLSSRKTC